jgi:hypothetical protein
MVRVGAEVGRVLDHESWFVGPALGARYRMFVLEVAVRRHAASFDEVTTYFGPPTVREIARRSRTERSWGGVARFLLVTR